MYLHKQGGMNQRWVIWEGEPFSSWACSEKKKEPSAVSGVFLC